MPDLRQLTWFQLTWVNVTQAGLSDYFYKQAIQAPLDRLSDNSYVNYYA
jgi:hypothetical protein